MAALPRPARQEEPMIRSALLGGLAVALAAGAAYAAHDGVHRYRLAAKNLPDSTVSYTRHHRHAHQAREAIAAGRFGEEAAYRGRVLDLYGGPRVVASAPVPDTPRNRGRFGGPMSNGGRMTAPAGD